MTISKGRISSLIDVKQKFVFFGFGLIHVFIQNYFSRELIPEGMTGGLVIFQDHPNYWDAWGEHIRCLMLTYSLIAFDQMLKSTIWKLAVLLSLRMSVLLHKDHFAPP
jgi:hypothetical protein